MTEYLNAFLEDQHPIVRSTLRTGGGILLITALFHLVAWAGVRLTNSPLLFQFDRFLTLYNTLLYLLLVFMVYHLLKVIYHLLMNEGVFTALSVVLILLSILVVGGSALAMPDVVASGIAYQSGRSYSAVLDEVSAYCEQWRTKWGEADTITLDVAAEDLGSLRDSAEVFRMRTTVLFNFAAPDAQDFGLACTLQPEAPSTSGRAIRYRYQNIGDSLYQFVENDSQ